MAAVLKPRCLGEKATHTPNARTHSTVSPLDRWRPDEIARSSQMNLSPTPRAQSPTTPPKSIPPESDIPAPEDSAKPKVRAAHRPPSAPTYRGAHRRS